MKARREADDEVERKVVEEVVENFVCVKNLGDFYNIEMLLDEIDDFVDFEEEEDNFELFEGWILDVVVSGGDGG